MKRDIARELYRSYRSGYKKKKEVVEQERSLNGEPEKISNLINELVQNREWRQGIAEGNLFSDWDQIVGSEVAEHATPITLFEGKLTIQTSSTAWSTQLRLIESELLKTIRKVVFQNHLKYENKFVPISAKILSDFFLKIRPTQFCIDQVCD